MVALERTALPLAPFAPAAVLAPVAAHLVFAQAVSAHVIGTPVALPPAVAVPTADHVTPMCHDARAVTFDLAAASSPATDAWWEYYGGCCCTFGPSARACLSGVASDSSGRSSTCCILGSRSETASLANIAAGIA